MFLVYQVHAERLPPGFCFQLSRGYTAEEQGTKCLYSEIAVVGFSEYDVPSIYI